MEFTGERVIPGQTDPDLFNEHLARYCFAEALVRSKRVLDAGCGVAYGAQRLAQCADLVVALDNSLQALETGRQMVPAAPAHYLQGDCARLPAAGQSFDVVLAFEVIEHLENWQAFLEESRRVLAPGGQLLISTPNRAYYAESRETPNPYHVHEFDHEEFRAALEAVFPHVMIFLENHTHAITFTPAAVQGVRTRLEGSQDRAEDAHFFLAVCSQRPLFGSPAFVYVPRSGNILRERESHIAKLKQEVAQKARWLEETANDLRELAEKRAHDQQEAQAAIDRLEAELKERAEWVRKSEAEMAAMADELDARQRLVDERTAWAQHLDEEIKRVVENFERLEQERQRVLNLLNEANETVDERTRWAQGLDRQVEKLTAELQAIYGSRGYALGRRLRMIPPPTLPGGGEE